MAYALLHHLEQQRLLLRTPTTVSSFRPELWGATWVHLAEAILNRHQGAVAHHVRNLRKPQALLAELYELAVFIGSPTSII
jgi:hypothetical protein